MLRLNIEVYFLQWYYEYDFSTEYNAFLYFEIVILSRLFETNGSNCMTQHITFKFLFYMVQNCALFPRDSILQMCNRVSL